MGSNIITKSESDISNIEKIIKYCSGLNTIFEYPYFFLWTLPTNHRDCSSVGTIEDSEYFHFRVGRYPWMKGSMEAEDVSKSVVFASIPTIIDSGKWVSHLLKKEQEFPLDQSEYNVEEIKNKIDEYLYNDLT